MANKNTKSNAETKEQTAEAVAETTMQPETVAENTEPEAVTQTAEQSNGEGEKLFKESEVEEMIKAAVASAMASINPAQPVIQVKPEEYVTLLFLGTIAEGTIVTMGKLGQFNRAGATRDIDKNEFLQNIDYRLDQMLKKRVIIVVNGLTSEERERYGLDYKDGELLSQKAFFKLLDYSADELAEIFSKLCPEHKKLVARMIITAYFEKGDKRVTFEKVKRLNDISKEIEPTGMLISVAESMAENMI